MPIYEYECFDCGARFEQWQRIGDSPAATCPNGHSQVRRLLSRPAIIFRGSGFYVTDHGRNGGGRPSKSRETKPAESVKSPTVQDSEP
jgi:putative FmdB family regulatory protein